MFARGHAGRLAPSMAAAKHSAKQASAAKRFAVTGVSAGKEEGPEGLAPRLGGRAGRHEAARDAGPATLAHGRFDAASRLGSAPEEGRSECAEGGMGAWSRNREVFSAHGSKDASIRLDLQPFHIPVLPSGRHVRLDIITTWGDPHYVGLSGLEMFDDRGAPIRVSASSISADPADINVLPGLPCPSPSPSPSPSPLRRRCPCSPARACSRVRACTALVPDATHTRGLGIGQGTAATRARWTRWSTASTGRVTTCTCG